MSSPRTPAARSRVSVIYWKAEPFPPLPLVCVFVHPFLDSPHTPESTVSSCPPPPRPAVPFSLLASVGHDIILASSRVPIEQSALRHSGPPTVTRTNMASSTFLLGGHVHLFPLQPSSDWVDNYLSCCFLNEPSFQCISTPRCAVI